MNQSIENVNNNFFQDSIEKISNKYNYIKNEKELLFYLHEESNSYGWKIEEFEENALLISKNTLSDSKENLIICLPLCEFSETISLEDDLNFDFTNSINILDNKLICKNIKMGMKNLVNSSVFLDTLDYSTELGSSLEKLEEIYNIKILIFEENIELSSNILKKLDYDKIILSLDEGNENSLQISQENIQSFESNKQLHLENSIFDNHYSIESKVLFGTNERHNFEKEGLNPLKFNFDIIDILENKFNIEILDISNIANLNERNYSSIIKIGTSESKIQSLLEELKSFHTNLINNLNDSNLKISIELKKETYNKDIKKISSKSIKDIKDLSLFLISKNLNNNIDKNNSINISRCNINLDENQFILKGTIQSNNYNSLKEIKNIILAENTKLDYNLIYFNEIYSNSIDKKDILRKKAIISYKNTNYKKNYVKTVNNLNQINALTNYNVYNKGFLYSYKVNKEDEKETININNLSKIYEWLNDFILELSPQI